MASPSWQHLYGRRWRKARKLFLKANPLCLMCQRDEKRPESATVVDHRIPHKGDVALFWDQANWQPLCKWHHDSVKRREEEGSLRPVIGDDGWPLE